LTKGFVYSDAWVDDARLVVLNALDAQEHGATILPCTRCIRARRAAGLWELTLQSKDGGLARKVRGRSLFNAAGPWVSAVLHDAIGTPSAHGLRLAKGSHIVVPRLFDHDYAYLLQNPDRRILFAIPYERDFTVIGTTDVEYTGNPADVSISTDEIVYLCKMASDYFAKPVHPKDVIWTYSGVRPLLADEASNLSAVTRDYFLEADASAQGAPLISVFGGKITTYRRLAEEALALLRQHLPNIKPSWTAGAPLPGGDIPNADFATFFLEFRCTDPWLPEALALRLARAYGTRVTKVLDGARSLHDLGEDFGSGLYEAEIEYLRIAEWAQTAEDILWRRTKLGLHMTALSAQKVASRLQQSRK
jgi:glycerol-3-phosphate dehydrogenase